MNLTQLSFIFGSILLLTGCWNDKPLPPKTIVKKEIVEVPKYEFMKVDLTGAYIEFNSSKERSICTPALIQARDVYVPVIQYYNWQIDENNKEVK